MKKKYSLQEKIAFSAVWVLRLVFFIGIFVTIFQGNVESAAILVGGLVVSFLPLLIERRVNITLPLSYQLAIVGFIFLTLFMGEVGDAYNTFWWWDIALHSSSGVLLGFAGFLVFYVLKQQGKLEISAGLIAFFTFSLGVASAGLWEIFEFAVDSLFGTMMQKGATDTMSDIIVGTVGAGIAAFAAYRYIDEPKTSRISGIVKSFAKANRTLVRKQVRKRVSHDKTI